MLNVQVTDADLPTLEIVLLKGWKAGRCYYKQLYRVRSSRPLTAEDEPWLRSFTYPGQEYSIQEKGKVGQWVKGDRWRSFYEYEIATGIDSSD